jgi:hypothetical protein
MKFLLTISTLVFTMMFSVISFAEWTAVSNDTDNNTWYVDFERVRKVDGYVYFWTLANLTKPDQDGDLSYKGYIQGDCKFFRRKNLQISYHKERWGNGSAVNATVSDEWQYPTPNSSDEIMLEAVCNR